MLATETLPLTPRVVPCERAQQHLHARENIWLRIERDLADFKQGNARLTAQTLKIDWPPDVLMKVSDRRTLFDPYPETRRVLTRFKGLGVLPCVVFNRDLLLGDVLAGLGWSTSTAWSTAWSPPPTSVSRRVGRVRVVTWALNS